MGVAYGLRCISLIYVLLYCDCHEMTYEITTTWDSLPVNHDPVTFKMSPGDGGLKFEVFAPFWDSPAAPDGPPGKPFPHLWNYEVVEAMFLSDDSSFLKDNYLEVELCPHGQQLVLFLHGESQSFKQQLPLSFNATITGNKWYGVALLPWAYFPPNINKVNLFAIHGAGAARVYEALSPVPRKDLAPGQKANFHLLQYFQDFCLQSIMGEGWVQPKCSDLWAGKC